MNFRLIQHIILTTWIALVVIATIPVSRQVITQLTGRTVTATVTTRSVWKPPYASWPHYDCKLVDSDNLYTISNTILACNSDTKETIKIDPFYPSRAQFNGDIFDNGTALDWYFLAVSAVFGFLGLVLKLTGFKAPWRTATLWLLNRLQGRPRENP